MRVLGWTLLALLSHWRRHRVQFLSVLTGLWLATALLTGVQALNTQARDSYARASQVIGGQPQASLVSADGSPIAQSTFVALRLQGWPVSPLLQGRTSVRDHPAQRLQLLGIEPVSLPAGSPLAGKTRETGQVVELFTPPGRTWIAPSTLDALGLQAGDRPVTEHGTALPPLQPEPDMAPGTLLMDIGYAQQALEQPQQVSRLLIPAEFAKALPSLPASLAGSLVLQQPGEQADLARLTDSFHLNLDALGVLSFIVGLFIVHAAIGLALEQRRGLLRNLRASGVSVRLLISALALELGTLALLGGLAGIVSGYWLASLLLPDVAASLRGLYGAEVAGQLSLSPWWWLAGLGVSLAGALLAGADSLLRAARLPLLALSQPQAWHDAHHRWLKRQGWISAAAALVAVTSAVFGQSLAAGFLLMASLLLAAALGLPVLLNAGLGLLEGGRHSPLGQWFIADCRQQLPALSLALMALLLAMAANIGAGSMTAGFRETFGDWLDQRLAAELYVSPQTPEQASSLQTWLQSQPLVDAVLPNLQVPLQLQGWPADLFGVIDHPHYRQHWPLLDTVGDDPWRALAADDTVMLSEQLARRLKVSPGDTLALPAPDGPWSLRVVGTYADYGNPRGHLLVNAGHLLRHWPQVTPFRFNVRVSHSAVPELVRLIHANFLIDDSHLVDQAQLKGWSVQIFERTFAATAALNSLTLGVAGVALFISLLTQSQGRLAQLAPLWALGVTRRRLVWLNLGQTWLLAVLTLLLAVPLGLLLAWSLDAVINVQAFGWRLPWHAYPGQIASLLALALLATLLASAWPLLQLYRSRPSDLLRTFADER